MAVSAPDPALRSVSALVFVEDLESPQLREDDARHLAEVLRLKQGEQIAASDGNGGWRICTFITTRVPRTARANSGESRLAKLEAAGPVQRLDRASPTLEIAFSWAKADRTEWAVAKLVELGIDRLTPLVADRTVVRPEGDERGPSRTSASQDRPRGGDAGQAAVPPRDQHEPVRRQSRRPVASGDSRARRARRLPDNARDTGRVSRTGGRLVPARDGVG